MNTKIAHKYSPDERVVWVKESEPANPHGTVLYVEGSEHGRDYDVVAIQFDGYDSFPFTVYAWALEYEDNFTDTTA